MPLASPLNFRRFTQEDWYGFAGASKFDDGTEPLLCETDELIVVVGGSEFQNGTVWCEIMFPVGGSACECVSYALQFDNVVAVTAALANLDEITPASLREYGFEKIL